MSAEALALLELLVATGAPGLAPSLSLEVGPTANGRLFELTPWQTRPRVTLRFTEEALRHPGFVGLLSLACEQATARLRPGAGAFHAAHRAPTAEQWCQATLDRWEPQAAQVRLTPDGMEVRALR